MSIKDKAVVFILLGQSNAVGHDLPMEDADIIKNPMKNVFGLTRELNQSFDKKELEWSGYTSFGMNLGEEQDNTYSVANCLADLWEREENLPELYIVHIAIGAQGISDGFMWNPGYEKKLIPGKLGEADISLLPLTAHILSKVRESLVKRGKKEICPILHWRGGEQEFAAPWEELRNNLENNYTELLNSLSNAFGDKIPVWLHKLVCRERCLDYDPEGEALKKLDFINEVFEKLARSDSSVSVFDVTKIPCFSENISGTGIFKEDVIHFTAEVNKWVSTKIFDTIKDMIRE